MKTIAKKNLPERLRQVDLVGDRSERTIPRFLTGSARNLIFTPSDDFGGIKSIAAQGKELGGRRIPLIACWQFEDFVHPKSS